MRGELAKIALKRGWAKWPMIPADFEEECQYFCGSLETPEGIGW